MGGEQAKVMVQCPLRECGREFRLPAGKIGQLHCPHCKGWIEVSTQSRSQEPNLPEDWMLAPMNRRNVCFMGMPRAWRRIHPPLSEQALLCIGSSMEDAFVEIIALGSIEKGRQSDRRFADILADLIVEVVPTAEEYQRARIVGQSQADLPNRVRLRRVKCTIRDEGSDLVADYVVVGDEDVALQICLKCAESTYHPRLDEYTAMLQTLRTRSLVSGLKIWMHGV